jgi:hypothetical protein
VFWPGEFSRLSSAAPEAISRGIGQLERDAMFVENGYRESRWSKFRSKRPSDEKSRFEVIVADYF